MKGAAIRNRAYMDVFKAGPALALLTEVAGIEMTPISD
jgi:hypothetical protein